ncbi:MAG: putative YigZ family protein [Lentimonas sp.]
MDFKQSYLTIGKGLPVEIKEKGSKFIGMAARCETEDQVKETLEAWWGENPQATHICYAYRIGVDGELYRANDDGEPNNSAGAPILGQITSFELTNVLVGVVRYYGGTKLGVGGLISAYKAAAKAVLEGAEKITVELRENLKIEFNYQDMPHIMAVLKRNRMEIGDLNLEENCSLDIRLSTEDNKEDIKALLAMYGSVKIKYLGIY